MYREPDQKTQDKLQIKTLLSIFEEKIGSDFFSQI